MVLMARLSNFSDNDLEPMAMAEGRIEASPTETMTLIGIEIPRNNVLLVMMCNVPKARLLMRTKVAKYVDSFRCEYYPRVANINPAVRQVLVLYW